MGEVRALVVRIGELRAALPLASVGETMRVLPFEPWTHGPAFVRGVVIVRGEPRPVVDLALVLGGAPAASEGRLVTWTLGARRVMAWVDEVVGVRAIPFSVALPTLLGTLAGEQVEAIAAVEGALVVALRGALAIPDATWTAIEARR